MGECGLGWGGGCEEKVMIVKRHAAKTRETQAVKKEYEGSRVSWIDSVDCCALRKYMSVSVCVCVRWK